MSAHTANTYLFWVPWEVATTHTDACCAMATVLGGSVFIWGLQWLHCGLPHAPHWQTPGHLLSLFHPGLHLPGPLCSVCAMSPSWKVVRAK